MGSVQPFLEGSFRSDRARGFGSIQSEAVTRVGRISKPRGSQPGTLSTIGRRAIISQSEGTRCRTERIFRDTREYSANDAPGTRRWRVFQDLSGSAINYVTAVHSRSEIVAGSVGLLLGSSGGRSEEERTLLLESK